MKERMGGKINKNGNKKERKLEPEKKGPKNNRLKIKNKNWAGFSVDGMNHLPDSLAECGKITYLRTSVMVNELILLAIASGSDSYLVMYDCGLISD